MSTNEDQYHFRSRAAIGEALPHFSEEEIKAEPMLFNCTVEAARYLGGPITRAFIEIGDFTPRAIIDTRSHMLMPGWYPSIPGWHHDDVPRTRSDGQPDYDAPAYRSLHTLALVNGEVCPTQFATGSISLPRVPLGGTIYREWHPLVEKAVQDGSLTLMEAPSNRLIFFDWQTFHQGRPAVRSGWRWFGRASERTNRRATNEIRRQVQVYL